MTPTPTTPDPSKVHPHGRGDNFPDFILGLCNFGSPPRAWGQWRMCRSLPLIRRFTPTGVGTMTGTCRRKSYHAVHPHGRGDNCSMHVSGMRLLGSPPRAWGQSAARLTARRMARFTPTGVGTMWPLARATTSATVHPHGRGDNCEPQRRAARNCGSPPRAWGQLVDRQ